MPSLEIYTLSYTTLFRSSRWSMGSPRPRAVVLDAGALIQFDRGHPRMRALIRLALDRSSPLIVPAGVLGQVWRDGSRQVPLVADRKSTRLNSSHPSISYAVPRDLHSFLHDALPIFEMEHGLAASSGCSSRRGRPHSVRSRSSPHESAHSTRTRQIVAVDRARRCARAGLARRITPGSTGGRSEEHTSELQSPVHLVCRPSRSTLFPTRRSSDLRDGAWARRVLGL